MLMERGIKGLFLCGNMTRRSVFLVSLVIITVVVSVTLSLYLTRIPSETQCRPAPHVHVDYVSFQIMDSRPYIIYNLKKYQSEPRLVKRIVSLDTLRRIADDIGVELHKDQQIFGFVMHVRQRDTGMTPIKPDSVLGASVFLYLTRDSNKPLLRLYEIGNGQWRPHTQFPEVVTRYDLDPTIIHHRALTQRQLDSTAYMVWLRQP